MWHVGADCSKYGQQQQGRLGHRRWTVVYDGHSATARKHTGAVSESNNYKAIFIIFLLYSLTDKRTYCRSFPQSSRFRTSTSWPWSASWPWPTSWSWPISWSSLFLVTWILSRTFLLMRYIGDVGLLHDLHDAGCCICATITVNWRVFQIQLWTDCGEQSFHKVSRICFFFQITHLMQFRIQLW